MEANLDEVEVPPLISVNFQPAGLPPGAVDLEDFTQFLDGLRMALEGVVEYENSVSVPSEQTTAPRLTIVQRREGSVIADTIINISILSYNTITINAQVTAEYAKALLAADGTIDAAVILGTVLRNALEGAATDAIKEGIKKGVSKSADAAKHLMRALKTMTTSSAAGESARLPPEETLATAPGARKMARIGSKQTYGDGGITVTSSADPDQTAIFNAESQRHIEEHAKQAQNFREPIQVVGTIENPNRGKRRFTLILPGQSKARERVFCQYEDRELMKLVDDLYYSHDFVKVVGQRRYELRGNPAKPKMHITVSRLERAEPPTLLNQSDMDTRPEQAS